jgi:glycosyltransferase involved in cell wall biosynthesis
MMVFNGLHVLLVGPVPPPAGGMANQTRQLGELLRAAGAQVELLSTNPPYRPAWVAALKGLRAGFRLVAYVLALWRQVGRVQVVHVMANSAWSWHLFAAPAVWVSHLRGVPVVVNYRGGEAGPFLARSSALVRFTMRRSSALVVPSGFLEHVFAGHGMASAVVPNIVDTRRFSPLAKGETRDPKQLLVARNLEALYGNDIALRALAIVRQRHADVRMLIAGSGPQEAELRALAAQLGLGDNVRFTGRLDRDDMARLLQRSALSVNPTRVDNMPNSVLEAMASGTPVVSTHVGGVPYMVKHRETAWLVPPDDPQALADAVLHLLENPTEADQLAAAALRQVQNNTWPVIAPLWAAVYRRAQQLGGRAAPAWGSQP